MRLVLKPRSIRRLHPNKGSPLGKDQGTIMGCQPLEVQEDINYYFDGGSGEGTHQSMFTFDKCFKSRWMWCAFTRICLRFFSGKHWRWRREEGGRWRGNPNSQCCY